MSTAPQATFADWPRTRDERRAMYRRIRNELIDGSPAATLQNVRRFLEQCASCTGRRDEPGDLMAAIPQHSLNALVAALESAERQLRARALASTEGGSHAN